MSRITSEQMSKMLDYMEENRWLATGHARTTHARDRTRKAWEILADEINGWRGQGGVKTWQQWAKFWKDKKATLRKKVTVIQTKLETEGVVDESMDLSPMEERMWALTGGAEEFAVGNTDTTHQSFTQSPEDTHSCQSDDVFEVPVEFDVPEVSGQSENSLSVQVKVENLEADSAGNPTSAATSSLPQPDPTRFQNGPVQEARSPIRVASLIRNNPTVLSFPRLHRLLSTRRRFIQRPQPASNQSNQSRVSSLTERLVAIEEKRLETDQRLAQNQEALLTVLRQMSEAWTSQNQTLKDLVEKLNHKQ